MEPFGLTLLIDKPLEWTSFDVVNKIRYAARDITGNKKVKVGHAGTLDPLASGLVIICIGKHTKRIEEYMGLTKIYSGSIMLGATRPSFDMETEIDKEFDLPANDLALLQSAAKEWTGTFMQMPPIFSAKKIAGKKAYEHARKGREVTLNPSQVHIESFEVDNSAFPEITFHVVCSKGTYIRSLANDFGKTLGSGAYLKSLRREAIGSYKIEDSSSIAEGIDLLKESYANYLNEDSE